MQKRPVCTPLFQACAPSCGLTYRQNQRWPKSGPGWYRTPASYGVPIALERETQSQVAQKWTGWLQNLYLAGRTEHFKTQD